MLPIGFEHTGEELSSQLAELEARELNQVERALLRLKQGTYGLCEACATKIPVSRLNVLPYSTLCIKCQREAENDSDWLAERRNGIEAAPMARPWRTERSAWRSGNGFGAKSSRRPTF
jgi:RNA polymerase-binding transcription factor DksA